MKLTIGGSLRLSLCARACACTAFVGLVACGAGGNASSHLAKEPAYTREAKCAITKSQAEPLIVEWPSSSRAKIEALAKTGVVAVRYNGCEMEVLASCNAPGKYGYTAITAKRDHVVIKSADDLYANIPLGAAALEGKLETSGELDVAMAIVGRYSTDKRVIRADELEGGDCAKATHFVSALTVGAFEFFAGADATIGGGVTAGGVGAGAKSATKRELLNSDGKMSTCDAATSSDTRPPEGCGAVVRLEVVPLGQAKKDDAVCPSGMQWNGTQCVKGAEGVAAGPTRSGAGEELRFEVAERDQSFTISVEAGGVTRACPEPVTYHKPCKLYDVPDGPATVHARGDVTLDREIKVEESGRAVVTAWNRGHGSEIGLGVTLAASGALVAYALADSNGFTGTGHSLDIVLLTVGGVFGLISLIGFPAALFSSHDLMTIKRGNNSQFVFDRSPLRLVGVGVAPAGTTVKSGGTLGLTFAF
jgi:hypothetical protein